jgi:hypothetical protein
MYTRVYEIHISHGREKEEKLPDILVDISRASTSGIYFPPTPPSNIGGNDFISSRRPPSPALCHCLLICRVGFYFALKRNL